MAVVGRGLGQPEYGGIAAGGLGASTPGAPGSMRGAAAGSSVASAVINVVWEPTGLAESDSVASGLLSLTGRTRRGGGGVGPPRPRKRYSLSGLAVSDSSAAGRLSVAKPLAGRSVSTVASAGRASVGFCAAGTSAAVVRAAGAVAVDDSLTLLLLM